MLRNKIIQGTSGVFSFLSIAMLYSGFVVPGMISLFAGMLFWKHKNLINNNTHNKDVD